MPNSIPQIALGLLVLGVAFYFIERFLGPTGKPKIFRKQLLTDIGWWFFLPLVGKQITKLLLLLPLGVLIALGITHAEELRSHSYDGFGPLAAQPMWLQAIEIFLINDLFSYWTHRLFHGGRWWPFHAVHHSSEHLDWLSSVRVHPVNEFVTKFFQITPLLFMGFNPLAVGSAPFILTLYALFLHANVNWTFGPLKYVFATPVFHRWHHSRDREAWDKNFAGLFSFYDVMFGTFYMPAGRVPENFGINDPMPAGLPGQVIMPFQWAWRGKQGDAAVKPSAVTDAVALASEASR